MLSPSSSHLLPSRWASVRPPSRSPNGLPFRSRWFTRFLRCRPFFSFSPFDSFFPLYFYLLCSLLYLRVNNLVVSCLSSLKLRGRESLSYGRHRLRVRSVKRLKSTRLDLSYFWRTSVPRSLIVWAKRWQL